MYVATQKKKTIKTFYAVRFSRDEDPCLHDICIQFYLELCSDCLLCRDKGGIEMLNIILLPHSFELPLVLLLRSFVGNKICQMGQL